MAAGIGKRYGGLKQMAPVGPHGESIIDYSVYDALRAGFDQVVFIIRKDIETDFREKIGRAIEPKVETIYVFQDLDHLPAGRQKPWGTGHAVLCCREVVKTPFAVLNADDFYGAPAFGALASFLQAESLPEIPPENPQATDQRSLASYAMVGYKLANTLSEHGAVARGVCQVTSQPKGLAGDYLVAIHERTRIQRFGVDIRYSDNGTDWIDLHPTAIASMNIWGFNPSLFPELARLFSEFLRKDTNALITAEFYLPVVVNALLQEGRARVKVLRTDAQWFGVTYQGDRLLVETAIRDLIRQRVYPENLWNG